MTKRTIEVKVSRFNSIVRKDPYYQTYQVSLIEGMSVLDVLDYIYEKIDSTLAYYSHAACRHGECGKCVLVVNGKACVICQTPVSGNISIETPSKFEIVKDLVYTTGR